MMKNVNQEKTYIWQFCFLNSLMHDQPDRSWCLGQLTLMLVSILWEIKFVIIGRNSAYQQTHRLTCGWMPSPKHPPTPSSLPCLYISLDLPLYIYCIDNILCDRVYIQFFWSTEIIIQNKESLKTNKKSNLLPLSIFSVLVAL